MRNATVSTCSIVICYVGIGRGGGTCTRTAEELDRPVYRVSLIYHRTKLLEKRGTSPLRSFGCSVRSCEEFETSQRTLPYPITLSNKNAAMHRALDGIAGVAC